MTDFLLMPQKLEYASALFKASLETKLPFLGHIDLRGQSRHHQVRIRLLNVLSDHSSELSICVFFDRQGIPLPSIAHSVRMIENAARQIKAAQCNAGFARRLLRSWRGGYLCPDDGRVLACVESVLRGDESVRYLHFNEGLAQERADLANSLIATLRTGERPLAPPRGPVSPAVLPWKEFLAR